MINHLNQFKINLMLSYQKCIINYLLLSGRLFFLQCLVSSIHLQSESLYFYGILERGNRNLKLYGMTLLIYFFQTRLLFLLYP